MRMSAPAEIMPGEIMVALQLASAASPVGSYAYSDALEQAVADRLISDEPSARSWIQGVLRNGLCGLDLPLLARMHHALSNDEFTTAVQLSEFLLACRETAELRASDRDQGRALLRVVDALAPERSKALRARLADSGSISYALGYAHYATCHGICVDLTATAYAYAWVENQVQCAMKLVPFGQTQAQLMIRELVSDHALNASIEASSDSIIDVLDGLDGIASGMPGHAIASARHETLYSRLYRS